MAEVEVAPVGYFDADGHHHCPQGHRTEYKAFTGGQMWICETDQETGPYPDAPSTVGPRARLLGTPGGAEELRRQMREHLTTLNADECDGADRD